MKSKPIHIHVMFSESTSQKLKQTKQDIEDTLYSNNTHTNIYYVRLVKVATQYFLEQNLNTIMEEYNKVFSIREE